MLYVPAEECSYTSSIWTKQGAYMYAVSDTMRILTGFIDIFKKIITCVTVYVASKYSAHFTSLHGYRDL